MPVEVKNLDKTISYLGKLPADFVHDKIKNKIGNFLMTKIKQRTLKGNDVHGSPFEDYHPKYAMVRKKKGLPTDIVDLFFTGSMMSSMTYTVQETSVRLFFQPTKDKKGVSNPAKAYWLHQHREFFSLSLEDITEVNNLYENYIAEVI